MLFFIKHATILCIPAFLIFPLLEHFSVFVKKFSILKYAERMNNFHLEIQNKILKPIIRNNSDKRNHSGYDRFYDKT